MFRIGAFSKIAQVPGSLLRYYDQIGLFSPAHIDPESGYRYYQIEQLPQLNRILALRDLGLSLDQITRMLHDNISTEEMRGMLSLKKSQVEQTLLEEFNRLRHIETRIAQIENDGKMSDYDIVVKNIPTQNFLSIREVSPTNADGMRLFQQVQNVFRSESVQNDGHCLAVMHTDMFSVENLDWEIGFTVEQPFNRSIMLPDRRQMTVRKLFGVETMATIVHSGDWAELHLGYTAIGKWIDTNGYQFDGSGREVFLKLDYDLFVGEHIVEIQFPITTI